MNKQTPWWFSKKGPFSQRSRNISLKPQWTCCPNFWYFKPLSQRSPWCYPFGWVSKHAKIDWSHANTLNDEPDKLTANPSTYLVQPEMVYYLCLSIENNSTGTSHTLQSQEHQVNRGQHGLFRVAGFQKNNHARTEDLSWKLSEMFLMYFYAYIPFHQLWSRTGSQLKSFTTSLISFKENITVYQ